MFKKLMVLIVCFVIILTVFSMPVYADIGPKPSVVIEFKGLENEKYYVTLLSKKESTGPYSVSDQPFNEDSFLLMDNKEEGLKVWKAFREYKDKDKFYFIEFFKKIEKDNTFKWTYYPPAEFKILIYFPESENFFVSEKYEKYAFDSYFTVDAKDLNINETQSVPLRAVKSYNYNFEILSLILRIILTIAIEILIALIFRLKEKNLLMFIFAVNMFTQVILNILLNITNFSYGSMMFVFNFIWMEILVFIIEAFCYSMYLKKNSDKYDIKSRLGIIYALCANAASFAVGLLIAAAVPGIF